MAKTPSQPRQEPIGDTLRRQRTEVMGKGLREMAAILGVAPAHLTDIEKGRRTPSDGLLQRISKSYRIDEATLRAGWSRAETVVAEIATASATNAAKVPELLRAARHLSADHWDKLIQQAKRLSGDQRQ